MAKTAPSITGGPVVLLLWVIITQLAVPAHASQQEMMQHTMKTMMQQQPYSSYGDDPTPEVMQQQQQPHAQPMMMALPHEQGMMMGHQPSYEAQPMMTVMQQPSSKPMMQHPYQTTDEGALKDEVQVRSMDQGVLKIHPKKKKKQKKLHFGLIKVKPVVTTATDYGKNNDSQLPSHQNMNGMTRLLNSYANDENDKKKQYGYEAQHFWHSTEAQDQNDGEGTNSINGVRGTHGNETESSGIQNSSHQPPRGQSEFARSHVRSPSSGRVVRVMEERANIYPNIEQIPKQNKKETNHLKTDDRETAEIISNLRNPAHHNDGFHNIYSNIDSNNPRSGQQMAVGSPADRSLYKSLSHGSMIRAKRNTFINEGGDGSSAKDIISLLSAAENLSVDDRKEFDSKKNSSDPQMELLSRLRSFIASSWKDIVSGDDDGGGGGTDSSNKQINVDQKQQINPEFIPSKESLSGGQTPPSIQYLLGQPQFTAPILQKVDDMSHLRIKPLRVAKVAPADSPSSFHAQNNRISSSSGQRTNDKQPELPTILSIHDGTKSHQYTYVQTTEDVRSHSSLPTKQDAIVRLNSARSSRQEKLEQLRESQGLTEASRTSSAPVSTSLLKQAVLVSTRPRKRVPKPNKSPNQERQFDGLENTLRGKSIQSKGEEVSSSDGEQFVNLNETSSDAVPFTSNSDGNVKISSLDFLTMDKPTEILGKTLIKPQPLESSTDKIITKVVETNYTANGQIAMQENIGSDQEVAVNAESLVVKQIQNSLKGLVPSKQIPFSIVILDQKPSKIFEAANTTYIFKDGRLHRYIDTTRPSTTNNNSSLHHNSNTGLHNNNPVVDSGRFRSNKTQGENTELSGSLVTYRPALNKKAAAGFQPTAVLLNDKLQKKTLPVEDGKEPKEEDLAGEALDISQGKVLFKMSLPSGDLSPSQIKENVAKSSADEDLPMTMDVHKLLKMISQPSLPVESLKSINRHDLELKLSNNAESTPIIVSKPSTNSDTLGDRGQMFTLQPSSASSVARVEAKDISLGKHEPIVTNDHQEITTQLPTATTSVREAASNKKVHTPAGRASSANVTQTSFKLVAAEKGNIPLEKSSTFSGNNTDDKSSTSQKTPKAISSQVGERQHLTNPNKVGTPKVDDVRSIASPIPVVALPQNFSTFKNPTFTIIRLPGSLGKNSRDRIPGGTDLAKIFSLVARSAAARVQAAAKASLDDRSG